MKFLQKIGKALLLPVSALPLCGLLMGIGYLLCPHAMQGGEVTGAVQTIGLFLIKAGGAVVDHIALLFAVGVGVGMAKERDGTAAIAALVSWLTMTTLLSQDVVTALMPSMTEDTSAMLAFAKIENPFIGMMTGCIGAACYNRFKDTKLPDWLGFFSGKRSTVIIAGAVSVAAAAVMFFVWPVVFGLLVKLGMTISERGALGAGIFAFLNRLLIPFGMHHALNNVFFFDTIGLGDITHYWAGDTSADVDWDLGIYMSGFFPCMMFGVLGAALAMIRCAPKERRKYARGILLSGAVCSLVCGVTEPFEFAFMFAAPSLYVAYALLYGIFTYAAALLGFRAGFAFSGGATDLLFSSSMPAAKNTWLIIPLGIAAFAVFYLVFRVMVTKLNLKTPGREDPDDSDDEAVSEVGDSSDTAAGIGITALLKALGGRDNLTSIDNCITRLRLEVADMSLINEKAITAAGAKGVMKIGRNGLQVIVGLNVQLAAEALKRAVKNTPSEEKSVPKSAAPAEVRKLDRCVIRCSAGEVMQPAEGRVIPLTEIPDPTFAEGVMGAGVGIVPEGDTVYSPFDGKVISAADTLHAVAVEKDGMEVLIHVGIDTVKLNGEGFECYVSEGDEVKAGQALMKFDRKVISEAGYSDIIAVTLTNSDEFGDVECMINHNL